MNKLRSQSHAGVNKLGSQTSVATQKNGSQTSVTEKKISDKLMRCKVSEKEERTKKGKGGKLQSLFCFSSVSECGV